MAINLSASVREKLTTQLLTKLRKQFVYGATTDGKYMSGLRRGKDYKVASVASVNIGTYTGAAITRQSVADTGTTINIDQYKYFDVGLDAVDANEAEVEINDLINEGGYALGDEFDQYIAAQLVAGAGTTNADIAGLGIDGTPIVVDDTNIVDYIQLLVQGLRAANANLDTSSIVLPHKQVLALQNYRGSTGSDIGAMELAKGAVDSLFGVTIYGSNNTPVGVTSGDVALAYDARALKWLDSMSKLTTYDPDDTFEDAAKALHVYGASVIAELEDAVVLGYVS